MTFDPDVKERIEQAFATTKRRIVFWEDDAGEFTNGVGELELDGADVAVVDKNEFETKRRLLCDELDARSLVYRAGGAGDAAYDFLLDVKLAAEPFSCSQAAVWAQDCGLGPAASGTVAAHGAFFECGRALGRPSSIKAALPVLFPGDSELDYHAPVGVHNGAEAMDAFDRKPQC